MSIEYINSSPRHSEMGICVKYTNTHALALKARDIDTKYITL